MGFKELLSAYLIAQGAHTGGHFYQAQNQENPMRDAPMRLNGFVEKVSDPYRYSAPAANDPYAALRESEQHYREDRNKKHGDIQGAGFAMQDKVRDLLEDPELKSQTGFVNALIKAGYLAGSAKGLTKINNQQVAGDIEDMKKSSGNKYTNALVGASILGDLYSMKNPKSNGNIQFTTVDGAPGLKYTMRW